jgi:hypothetical protein
MEGLVRLGIGPWWVYTFDSGAVTQTHLSRREGRLGDQGLFHRRQGSGHRALYLVGGDVIYLVLWLYGLVIGHDNAANFVPVITADNWLHLTPDRAQRVALR